MHTGLVSPDIGSLLQPPVPEFREWAMAAALLPVPHRLSIFRDLARPTPRIENFGVGSHTKYPGVGLETRFIYSLCKYNKIWNPIYFGLVDSFLVETLRFCSVRTPSARDFLNIGKPWQTYINDINFQERNRWRSWFTIPLNTPHVTVLRPYNPVKHDFNPVTRLQSHTGVLGV